MHGVQVVPVLLLSLSLLSEMLLLFHVEFRDSNIKCSPEKSGEEGLRMDVFLGQ